MAYDSEANLRTYEIVVKLESEITSSLPVPDSVSGNITENPKTGGILLIHPTGEIREFSQSQATSNKLGSNGVTQP